MLINKKKFIIPLVVAVLVGVFGCLIVQKATNAVGVGHVTISQKEYQEMKYMSDKYTKLEQLWDTVDKNYYKGVNDEDLQTAMYKGLVKGLDDPYSVYMTKNEYDTWEASTTGEFGGIGVVFSENKDGKFIVNSVIDGTPAKKAGIKAGDQIISADGKKYDNADALAAALRGTKGTKVTVEYKRNGKTNKVTITRKTIITKTIKSSIKDGNIGYISISGFEKNTASDFKKALTRMEKKKVHGLIIDLRDNGGGLVDSSTDIADMLMGKGTITYMKDQSGHRETYTSDANKTSLPYVVLVNGNSASASEILSAAIKDSRSGKLVGTKTYGKGVVQSTQKFDDGSALKLTIMQYFSPKGHVINKKGVTPNYVVKGSNAQMKKALSLLK